MKARLQSKVEEAAMGVCGSSLNHGRGIHLFNFGTFIIFVHVFGSTVTEANGTGCRRPTNGVLCIKTGRATFGEAGP